MAEEPDFPKVTAALIRDGGRLFIGQRPPEKRFGLFWEFPGGKVEPGEDLKESLVREIREELCVEVMVGKLFKLVRYRGEGFGIDLYAYWCSISGGTLCLKEHIASKWVLPHELKDFGLTDADRLLIPFLESLTEMPENP